jgi:hypothetical protein
MSVGQTNLIRYSVFVATVVAMDKGFRFSWYRRTRVWPFYSVRR